MTKRDPDDFADPECDGCAGGDKWPVAENPWRCPVCDTEARSAILNIGTNTQRIPTVTDPTPHARRSPFEHERDSGPVTLQERLRANNTTMSNQAADALDAAQAQTREAVKAALEAAAECAYDADSLELAQHGEGKIVDRIRAIDPDAIIAGLPT